MPLCYAGRGGIAINFANYPFNTCATQLLREKEIFMADEIQMIGNVQFYKSDIAKTSVKTNEIGTKTNTVFMKDGTKIEFSDQQITDPKKMPSVMMGRDGAVSNAPQGIKFSNFGSGKVTGTPNKDYYYFENSGLTVNVAEGDNADTMKVVHKRGENTPLIFKDSGDKQVNVDMNNGLINMNEGLWLRG